MDETTSQPAAMRPAALGFLVWALARIIGLTLRIRFEHYEHIAEATRDGKGAILVTWHGRTFLPANVFRNKKYWALISLSRDGEIQNRIFQHFGYQTIRGSTGRGGVRGVLQLAKKLKQGGVVAFTPDGPRGPSHKVQEGTIFLAQRCGCPVIPIGSSARFRKLLPTWDHYLIPAPFTRCAFVVGEPIPVPSELDEEGKQRITEQIEEAMNAVETRAEELVRSL